MGKNFKLLMTFLLCLLGMAAKAQDPVAKFNGTNYATLQEAIDAAEAADPAAIVIDLLGDAVLDITAWDGTKNALSIGTVNTQSITINGGNHTLTFNQKNSDWNNIATMNDEVTKLILNNMDITSSGYNNGPWNRHDLNFNCAVELNNVTSDKALAFKNDAKLKNVTVTDNGDIYGIWIQPNGQTVDIDGLTLTVTSSSGRGIKIDNQYVANPQKVTLNISNASFNTSKKSAILVKSPAGADITVGENVNISNVAADKVNVVWCDANAANYFDQLNVSGATAIIEGTIAKIGKNFYETIADAVAAATEGQTVEVFAAGTYTLPGLPVNITVEGAVEGVVFNHTTAGNIASIPNGATFKNVAFNFGNVDYHGFQHAGTINMEDCTLNGRLTSYGDMNFTNCVFVHAGDYHMWCYSGNVTYTGCTFTNSTTGKFLNVYNEGIATKYTVTVTDCKFVNQASAANKAALNVKATSGSNLLSFDVIINNCTTEGAFPTAVGEQANADKTWILNPLAQVDDRKISPDNITVTQDGVLIYPKSVAQIGDAKYPTLQSAVDAAQQMGGEVTVNIIDDISGETVTVKEVANFKLTIDGKKDASSNYTVDATIVVDGLRGNGGSTTNGASVTIQNIAFVKTTSTDGIQATHYPHHVTVQNCTYSGSNNDKWFFNASVDGPLYGVTIKDVTVEHARLIYANLAEDAVFQNITATNDCTVGFNVKTSGTALIENCQVTTPKYAFRDYSDAYEGTFTLKDNTFTSTSEASDEGVIVNRGGAVGTAHINVESGTYSGLVRVLNNKEGVLAISGGYFSKEFPQNYIAADLVAEGKVCVPAQDKPGFFTVGEPAVAKYNNVTYPSLQAALDAAEADDPENIVIDLLDDCTLDITARANVLSIGTSNTQSIVINGGNHTLTFNQKNSDWNDVSTANDAVTKLVLNNMTITNSGYNSGHWKRTNVFFSCNVEMNNVTSTALGFKNDATLNNVTITDNRKDIYGIWISTNGNNVAINGLTLNTTGDGGRGIAIKDEDSQKIDGTSLEIANASFATEKKGAIIVTSSYTVDITAGEGINIANVAKDAENLVWVDEKKAEEFYKVKVTGATVVPETKESDYVAKLIDTDNTILGYYKALNKAINTATTGQTVAILQANTYTLPGLPQNITVEGDVEGVQFTHTTAGNVAAIPNGATFKNVAFNFDNVNYHGFQHAGTINMEGCTLNGKLFSYGDMNFTNCTFNQSNSDYHMWAYAGNLTYTDCTFTNTATGKFLNVYNEGDGGSTKYTVTVTDCNFINQGASNKAALNVKATCGTKLLAYDVIINNCTTEGAFPEANWGDALVVLNSVAQVDDRTADGVDNIKVWQDDVLIYPVYVAQIGETQYPTLQSALNAAHEMTGDVTVELLKDIKGYSIVHQKAGLNLTIDGKDKTLAGQIFIDGNGRASGTETLTIKNFKFEGNTSNFYSGTDAFILVPSTKDTGKPWSVTNQYNYAHNITVTDCSFTSTSTSDEYDVVCYKATSGAGEYNVTITNCTATGTMMHSLAQLTGTTGGSITNCIVTGSESFVNVSGGTGDFTVSGNTFTSAEGASGYGIRENGTSDAVITLTDNTFTAANAVVLGKGTNVTAGTINVVSGIYVGEITKTDAATGKIVISGGHFSASIADAAYADFIAEGLCGVNGIYLNETPEAPNGIGDAVASVTFADNTTLRYASLEAAMAAAPDGSTVTLLKSTSGNGIIAPEGKFTTGVTVDFGGFTYTMDGAMVGSTGTQTQAFQLLKDNKITFKNGTIYSEKALMLIQNYSDLTLEGMTLTLNNANYSSAYTLSNNNGTVVIDGTTINANPAGGFAFDVCRYASYPSVNVTVKGESVINGNIEVSASGNDPKDGFGLTLEAGTFNGAIVLDASAKAVLNSTPEKAVITKSNSLTSVAAPQDFKWVDNNDGTSTLKPCVYVAQIGEGESAVKYESLADAVAAVPTDGTETTITMIDNEMIDVVGSAVTIPSTKNVVLDLNGFVVSGQCSTGKTSALILNNGTLKIQDSSDVSKDGSGNGKLSMSADPFWVYSEQDPGGYASNLIRNEGVLIVESGQLYNMGTGSATYAIDNYSAGKVTINGGKVDAAKASAIRMFYVNGGSVTVNDGIIGHYTSDDDCAYMGIQAQSGTNVNITVTGGTISGNYALYNGASGGNTSLSGGTFDGYVGFAASVPNISITGGRYGAWVGTWGDQEGFISGGVFAQEVSSTYIVAGQTCVDNTDPETKDDYPYTIGPAEIDYYWAEGGSYVHDYLNFPVPFKKNYLCDGEFIKLLKDVTLAENIACNLESGSFTLTFDDYTVTKGDYSVSLKEGITVYTDKQTDIFTAVDPDCKVVEAAEEGGYSYTVVPKDYICAIGTTKYETLADAVAAAGTSAATITLLTEAATDGVISGNGVVVPSGSNITFDLNGLTYNVSGETVGSSTTETQGFQLLQGSTVKFQNGTLKATATTAQMLIQNYCNLTLTDVTLDGTGLSGWAYALSNNCGTINLTGSTSIIAKEGGRAFDTCKFGSYAIPTVNINTTGTISGPIEATGGKLNIENGKFDVTWVTDSHYAAGDIQITGGIYTAKVIDEYCAEGYVCTDNEDEETKAQYPYTVMENELAGVFDLVDWEPYPYQGETKKTPRISYTRDTSKGSNPIGVYRCWYVPFDYTLKEEDLENADFFKVHMIAGSGEQSGLVEDNSQVYIHIESLKAGQKLTGNRPYVVRYKNEGIFKYEQENTTIYAVDDQSSRLYMATSEWDYNFFGTYDVFNATKAMEWMSLASTGYVALNATANAKLQQYRWYIRISANTINDDYSNLRIGFVVDGEEQGDATPIYGIDGEADGSDEISGIYSVDGTKYGTTMDDLQKGVNIIRYKNGTSKKVLVK